MKQLVLASNNPGKLREFSQLLAALNFVVLPQSEFNIHEAAEPHVTFVENALAKARHAARLTGFPALADDSGICVPALGGAPGVYSARYANLSDQRPRSDTRNNEKLLQELAGQHDRRAYYVCVLVFLRQANDPQPLIAEGIWQGEIIDTPAGDNGFGYDPYFWLPQHQCTAAQLAPAEKNAISHRGIAMQHLLTKMAAA